MHQLHRTRPATPEDLWRLADLAHARGLRVFEVGSQRWFCTSHSNPFALHVVTGFSCDCRGFMEHQRCSHHAALLAHLGWLPELEDAAPASATVDTTTDCPACPACCGCGVVTYRTFEERCTTCGGSGVRPNHHLHDVPPAPMVAAAA
jgi:hypothetical protein